MKKFYTNKVINQKFVNEDTSTTVGLGQGIADWVVWCKCYHYNSHLLKCTLNFNKEKLPSYLTGRARLGK